MIPHPKTAIYLIFRFNITDSATFTASSPEPGANETPAPP